MSNLEFFKVVILFSLIISLYGCQQEQIPKSKSTTKGRFTIKNHGEFRTENNKATEVMTITDTHTNIEYLVVNGLGILELKNKKEPTEVE